MSVHVFGLGILLSQFYLFKSGLPQVSHVLLVIPVILYLLKGRGVVFFPSNNDTPVYLMLLFLYVALVNFFYAIILHDLGFILPIVYLLYGLMVYFAIQNILITRPENLKVINFFLFLSIFSLFIMAVLGLGGFRFFPRYNAFFNDPNQMAFWALCVSAILLAQKRLGSLLKVFVLIFLLYIIIKSASRSGLVGMSILVIGMLITYAHDFLSLSFIKKLLLVFLIFILLVAGLSFINNMNLDNINLLESRLSQTDLNEQADIRGYSRFFDYPEYLVLGAGHGSEMRFNSNNLEIHSTWAGLLFYYGIPGLLFMMIFIVRVFFKLDLSQKFIFLAPLLYSFSTLGYRTPIFWIFLAFFFYLSISARSNIYKFNYKAEL